MRAVGSVAAVLALLVAACGGDSSGSSEVSTSQPATTAPTATTLKVEPSTTTTEVESVPFDAGSLVTGWIPVLEEGERFGAGGGSILRLASADFGLVAVGSTCESLEEGTGSADCYSAAWVSADGLDWDKVFGPEAGLGEGRIKAVTAGGPGVVAVGSTCAFSLPLPPLGCLPAVWTSTNGRDWTSQPQPEGTFEACVDDPGYCRLDDVVNTGEMLVASGFDAAGFGVWTSPDGEAWTKVSFDPEQLIPRFDEEQVDGDAEFWHMVAAGPGVVALGDVTVFEYDGDEFVEWWYPGAVWTSADGDTWKRVEDPDGLFGDLGDTTFADVTVWRGRIIAVGELCDRSYECEQILWSSADGSTWDARSLGSQWEPFDMQRITAVSEGLMVAGSRETDSGTREPALMFSPDGDTWTVHGLDPDLFDEWIPWNDMIEFEGRLIALGRDQINVLTPPRGTISRPND